MGKDKVQLLRLVFIDQKIREGMQAGNLANCSGMAREYEVSPKTIMRDIDYLKYQRDAPIEYDKSGKGYFYTEENYSLPALTLTESDLFAICIGRNALKQHENTPVYQKLASVFKKIEDSLPEKVSVQPFWVDNKISFIQDPRTHIDFLVWESIAAGLHHNQRLQILYQKPGAEHPQEREVDPYHVLNYQGEWYMIGYCHNRMKILTFAVSRIKKAKQLASACRVAEDFNSEHFIKERFGIFGGESEYEVRIHFAVEHVPYLLEREWHPTQKIEKAVDGGVILSLKVSHLYEIKRWILSWGSGVKALAPKELVKEIEGELKRTLVMYS
jgi:proteasome accessory factor B